MRVIVGLGNPGPLYEDSRHNVGLLVVAGLARESGVRLTAGRGDFMRGLGSVAGRQAALVLPLTLMNESGGAVSAALLELVATPQDLLVVCDDVWLPLGRLRLRRDGGAGGHNGLASIITSLDTRAFARLRLGVGAPPDPAGMVDFVVGRFRDDELSTVGEMTRRSMEAIRSVLADGIDSAMNIYNRRPEGAAGTLP